MPVIADKNTQNKLVEYDKTIVGLKGEIEELVKGIEKDQDGNYKLDINSAKFSEIDSVKEKYENTVKERDAFKFLVEQTTKPETREFNFGFTETEEDKQKNAFKSMLLLAKDNITNVDFVGRASIPMRYQMQMTGTYNAGTGPAGVYAQPTRLDTYVDTFQGILNAFNTGLTPTEVDWLTSVYIAEIFEHNNAGITAEGIAASQSDFATAEVSVKLVNVVHTFDLTQQQILSVKYAEDLITRRGRQMLDTKMNNYFLNSTDTNMKGLNNIVGLTTRALAGGNFVDGCLNGVLDAMNNGVIPTHFITSPTQWGITSLLKDGQSRYLLGDPANGGARTLWGLPIVVDSQQPTTKTICADLVANIEKYVYGSTADVAITNSDNDKFQKSISTARINRYMGLACYRPAGHVVITH